MPQADEGPARSPLADRSTDGAREPPKPSRKVALPENLPPRGLSRAEAAAYLGIGTSLFDEMVADGRMPVAKRINSRRIWDRRKLDIAFDALPDDGSADDPWGRVSV